MLNLYNEIFTNEQKAIEYCFSTNYMKETKECECGSERTIITNKRRRGLYTFKCRVCKRTSAITVGTMFHSPKVAINEYLKAIYMWVIGMDTVQIELQSDVCNNTFFKIKEKILNKININNFNKIGGENTIVQIDETAICRGKIITNPSNTLDETKGIQWIVGGVVEGNPSEVFLTLVPDRKINTIYNIFNQFLIKNSIIRTDGYPSYPTAVAMFGSEHQVVLHTEGFKNEDGQTTNAIENLWSHLKSEYRRRNGLRKEKIDGFLREFFWRKRVVKERSPFSLTEAFYSILENFK